MKFVKLIGYDCAAMQKLIALFRIYCDYLTSTFAADLTLPWIFRHLPSGGYWYLLYNYRSGGSDTKLRKYLHDWKLEQLALPCLSVTADLVSGQSVVREQGDAVHAILESINLPMLSAPICRNGQVLIDGGVMNNIPADVLTAQGCNFVIAVSVSANISREFGENKPDAPTPSMRIPSSLRTILRPLAVAS